MVEYERLSPDFISVSFSAGDPQFSIESNIQDPEVLDHKLDMILFKIMDIACVVKRNDWDKFYDDRKNAFEEYAKKLKAEEKELKKLDKEVDKK